MADEKKTNLEPIDEKDLELKRKFTGALLEKKDVLKENVPEVSQEKSERKEGVVEKDQAYSKILSKVKSQQQLADDSSVQEDAQKASEEIDIESKINNLVKLAMEKGVFHAVKVARHLEDNYVLDELHDRLLGDELHNELVKKGLIKDI